ncbi:AI-2E family transporter [Candidatus Woesearchaeota archaeon]|nr:AI-2E family transporter [Candidatus Woesearchaeota archaeon]
MDPSKEVRGITKKDQDTYTKYLLIAVFLIIAFLSFLIIKPFLVTLITGCLIAYIFFPFYRWTNNRIKRPAVSSLIVSILLILIIAVPALFIANSLSREAYVSYTVLKQKFVGSSAVQYSCESDNYLCQKTNMLKKFMSEPKVKFYIEDWLTKLTNWFVDNITNFIVSLPQKILNLFIMFFVIYYMFIDGEIFVSKMRDMLPFAKGDKRIIFKQFSEITSAVIYGSIVTAIAQGIIGGIGLWIFRVESPIMWGSIMIIAALLPYVGSAVIWAPIGIYRAVMGYLNNDTTLMWLGIGLLIYGLLIISTIDNIIRPKLIGNKARLHPVIVLLGVIGGISIFGMAGLVIGPVVLSLSITVLKIYTSR